MQERIKLGIGALIIISLLFMGFKVYKLNKRVDITESGISQIVQFINQAVANSQK